PCSRRCFRRSRLFAAFLCHLYRAHRRRIAPPRTILQPCRSRRLNVSAWPISPELFRIEPIFSPRLWGSRSLAPLFPEKSHLAEPLGEAWLTGIDCKIATGPFAAKTLGAAWHEMPED